MPLPAEPGFKPRIPSLLLFFLVLFFFFWMWAIFKVFIEFVTILLLFYVLTFWS